MIASTLVAAALASTSPVQATPAPAPMPADQAAMKCHEGAEQAKMDCCEDGCACCAKYKPAA